MILEKKSNSFPMELSSFEKGGERFVLKCFFTGL